MLSLKQATDITDENGNVAYTAKSKVFSLHDKTDIYDANNNHVAHIKKKVLSLHERHYVSMDRGIDFQLSNELMHIFKDVTNIEGLGWQLRGNIIGLHFALFDSESKIIATISQKMVSIHDKYCVDIYQTKYEDVVVAILITLQHMIRDRENTVEVSDDAD